MDCPCNLSNASRCVVSTTPLFRPDVRRRFSRGYRHIVAGKHVSSAETYPPSSSSRYRDSLLIVHSDWRMRQRLWHERAERRTSPIHRDETEIVSFVKTNKKGKYIEHTRAPISRFIVPQVPQRHRRVGRIIFMRMPAVFAGRPCCGRKAHAEHDRGGDRQRDQAR